jgi:cysteinyl-tRNA synthetase
MRLSNSLTRQMDELPSPPGPVRMYFCGPTVYQWIHIGNARPFVLSMWLKRWLQASGYDVVLVENVTDINDKIYDAARAAGLASDELARRSAQRYFEDTGDLGLGRPDVEPLATESVPAIVSLIADLVDRGLAYESSGDVYFRVARFPDYGVLSGVDPDEMRAQEPSDLKEDPRDFALWKATKPHEDTAWDSPWGRGRPGWHIECSAMAEAHLGPAFEIHGGGTDLRFPHHENELAQSRGAGREFARIWMHNGMLQLAAEKMSKSVGNIVSLREALDRWGRETILLFFLTGHWSKPIDFSDETMEQARAQAQTFRDYFVGAAEAEGEPDRPRLAAVLEDDFNTPDALALFHEWRSRGETASLAWGLDLFGLGALTIPPSAPDDVRALAEQRLAARGARDFAEADRLRGAIEDAGWEVRDVEAGFQLVPR